MNVFHEAKYRESLSPLLKCKPMSARQQRVLAWRDITGSAPDGPRHFLLRAIVEQRLSKRDADRDVFGTALSLAERRRDYLSRDGEAFDLFLMDCLYEYYGDYNASTMNTTIRAWEAELWDIVQEVRSKKHAREILIDAWLAAHGPYYKRNETPFTRDHDTHPAF